jgi:hypothetical protein
MTNIQEEAPFNIMRHLFSGDQSCSYAGANGFSVIMTCQRDHLPNGIPTESMCKKKASNQAHLKATGFNQPINLAKIVAADEAANRKGYVCVHTTF